MTLRILAGLFKNRPLKAPQAEGFRPTTSLMRKSVFDILQPFIQGADFLDLFACSGAMGIEALSREANFVTFIDKDPKAIVCIQANLQALKLEDKSEVLKQDAWKAMQMLEKANKSYDIIYIDPPYVCSFDPKNSPRSILHFLDTSSLLKESCIVFVEEGLPGTLHPETLRFTKLTYKDTRRFSQSLLHQFRTF